MANSKGPSSMRSMMYNGKSSLLPPKSPFPSISSLYGDYAPSSTVSQRGIAKPKDGNSLHQRTSSESCLVEEQPSWLDDLLNEPETPARRGGHRRSSSDSFAAYIDAASLENLDGIAQDDNNFRNITPVPSWGSQDFDYYINARHATSYIDHNSSNRHMNRARDASSIVSHSRGLSSPREHVSIQMTGSSWAPQGDRPKSAGSDKQDLVVSGSPDPNGPAEERGSSHSKTSSSESDTKRAKQQFAQRSRVRKLQYISELERNVQALQVEGSEVSGELEFLNQQNLILSMENKALKQRLENLAQEKLIKYLEHEVLERERARLRALYQQLQQPQQQQPSSNHRRSTSKDLDQQFANLSLKYKGASSVRDPVSGQLHI